MVSIPGQGTKISSHASRRGQKMLSSKRILSEEDIRLHEGCWDKGESSKMSHIGREKQVVMAASVYRGFLGGRPCAGRRRRWFSR